MVELKNTNEPETSRFLAKLANASFSVNPFEPEHPKLAIARIALTEEISATDRKKIIILATSLGLWEIDYSPC
jgi:ERCC4-related helicase